MPLFESQKARNTRLFMVPLEMFLRNLRAWLAEEAQAMGEAERDHYWMVYEAWAVGGTAAANAAVSQCDCLKSAWGRGDEARSRLLAKTFGLAMISPWYRRLGEGQQHSEEERTEAVRIAASNVAAFFGDYSGNAVDDFLKMDAQFNLDEDLRQDVTRQGLPLVFYALLCGKAESACTGVDLDLSPVTLPADEPSTLDELGLGYLGFFDIMATATAFNVGVGTVLGHYAAYAVARGEEPGSGP
jgi:hypothetical protein